MFLWGQRTQDNLISLECDWRGGDKLEAVAWLGQRLHALGIVIDVAKLPAVEMIPICSRPNNVRESIFPYAFTTALWQTFWSQSLTKVLCEIIICILWSWLTGVEHFPPILRVNLNFFLWKSGHFRARTDLKDEVQPRSLQMMNLFGHGCLTSPWLKQDEHSFSCSSW